MKTTVLALALVLGSSLATFGQGKITLGNDSLHLIVDDFGVPMPQAGGWDDLTMQLMGGPAAFSMTLQTTLVGAAMGNPVLADGRLASYNVVLSGVGPGLTGYLQLLFFSTAAGSYENALNGAGRHGASPIFTVTTGSFAYNSIVSHTAPGNSTWSDNPLYIFTIPEPSVGALGIVATSLLLIRRRRRMV